MELEDAPRWCWSLLWIIRRLCHVLLVLKQPIASSLIIWRQIICPSGRLSRIRSFWHLNTAEYLNVSKFSIYERVVCEEWREQSRLCQVRTRSAQPRGLACNALSLLFLFRVDLQSWCVDRDIRDRVICPICVSSIFYMLSCTDGMLLYIYIYIYNFPFEAEEARFEAMCYINWVTLELEMACWWRGTWQGRVVTAVSWISPCLATSSHWTGKTQSPLLIPSVELNCLSL